MRIKSLISCWLALVMLAQSVFADVVVLRNGDRYTGTLANREQVRANPRAADTIAILPSDSEELQRFPVGEIAYLILEDSDRQEVLDLLGSPTGGAIPALTRRPVSGDEDIEIRLHTGKVVRGQVVRTTADSLVIDRGRWGSFFGGRTVSVARSDVWGIRLVGDYEFHTLPADTALADLHSSLAIVEPAARHGNYGVPVVLLGTLAAGVGALVKFGGPKCTVTQTSVDCDEKSYDIANYALIGAGALLIVLGIVSAEGASSRADGEGSRHLHPHHLALQTGGAGNSVAVGYRFSF